MSVFPQQSELAFLTIGQAAKLLQTGRLSPVELTRAILDHIEQHDIPPRAYITVTADWAMDQARLAEQEITRGSYRGPLHGIPLGLKDNYDTAGVRTTAGSMVLAENVPLAHAAVVVKLLAAGAVIVGKHNLHEFAYGFTSINPHFGTPLNPWKSGHLAGGSSGGTAVALANGLCLGGMGSDTGGSIRVPAAFCGLTGLKPTFGRVSLRGVVPLSWSLDHAGPLARSAADCALLLNAIAGYDPDDVSSIDAPVDDFTADLGTDLRGVRIGPIRDFMEDPHLTSNVATAVERAVDILRGLGATVVEAGFPGYQDLGRAVLTILYAEAAAYHAAWVASRPADYDPALLAKLQRRSTNLAVPLANAYRLRTVSIREADALLTKYDALVGPTTPRVAPRVESGSVDGIGSFTEPFNLNGLPVLSVPCGFDDEGLPIGLSIVGRRWGERTILRIGHAYQQATDWHRRRPLL